MELPLIVWSGVFFLFPSLKGQIFGVFFAPFLEDEISDYIAHGPIIRVLTVINKKGPLITQYHLLTPSTSLVFLDFADRD